MKRPTGIVVLAMTTDVLLDQTLAEAPFAGHLSPVGQAEGAIATVNRAVQALLQAASSRPRDVAAIYLPEELLACW